MHRLGVVAPVLVFVVCACGATTSSRNASGHPLPAQLLTKITAVARETANHLGDSSVKTAKVFGPESRVTLVKASSGDSVRERARGGTARFYLIVLHGHFACSACSYPAGAKPPHGTIATVVWSPKEGGTDFGLSARLPASMSRLGAPRTVVLN